MRQRRLDRGALYEVGLVAFGLLTYFLIRGSVADQLRAARAHALAIIYLEQRMGLFVEPQIQRLLTHSLLQIQLWDAIYFWGHAPLIVVVAICLYRYRRRQYTLIRNSFLLSAIVGLVVYTLYPVAPPRLVGGYGFVDTMQRYSSLSYQAQSLRPFVNPYAAMPSLHVGWSFLIAVGLAMALRGRLRWVLIPAVSVCMFLAVLVTANHYIFDALAGLADCTFGLAGAFVYQVWQGSRSRVSEQTRAEANNLVRA